MWREQVDDQWKLEESGEQTNRARMSVLPVAGGI